MYAARTVDGTVVQAIVGTPEWAADRLGGVWVGSDVKVGVGWVFVDGELRPPQPYPSWTWNNGWQPPVPYPDDDGFYEWDEAAQEWIELSE